MHGRNGRGQARAQAICASEAGASGEVKHRLDMAISGRLQRCGETPLEL
jgi:hypothetical protein